MTLKNIQFRCHERECRVFFLSGKNTSFSSHLFFVSVFRLRQMAAENTPVILRPCRPTVGFF